MRVVLRIETGTYAGRSILLRPGQAMNFGRTERSDYSLPHDDLMSSVHFHVECHSQNFCVRIRDLGSTNGTHVNETRIVETELQDGDRVSAGRTTFAVCIESGHVGQNAVVEPPVENAAESDAAMNGEAPSTSEQSSEPVMMLTGPDPSTLSAILARIESKYPYAAGLQDPDQGVRREALYAAARTGQKWLLEYCRCLAAGPLAENWEPLRLLAILGQSSDLERILAIGRCEPLGPQRFEILASFGHPRVIPDLLVGMESPDPETAAAAGAAFAKITGFDVTAEAVAPTEAAANPEVEEEASEELSRPDAKLAGRHWLQIRDQFRKGRRWRRAMEISRPLDASVLATLDLECQFEILLRGAYEGQQ